MASWHQVRWSCDLRRLSGTLLVLLLLVTGLMGVACNHGYGAINPVTEETIDEFIEEILSCREIVGMNLAVVKGDKVLLAKGYGYANIETEACVNDATIFGIASLTKAFASTLLGVLIDKDESLTWDTPVKDILGDNFHFHDILRTEKMTLRDLLTHRTGIPPNNYVRLSQPNREQLAGKMRFFEATQEFRGSYLYNNIMYGLISHISETIGGKSWEDLMREHIFLPLGMSYTTFTHETNLSRPEMAVPYLPDDDEWRQVSWKLHRTWGELGGSGSIISNALDMAKWLILHVNDGISQQGSRVVNKDILEELHKPQNNIPETDSTKVYRRPYAPVSYVFHTYGLGWRQGYYRGYPILTHTGTSWGFGALLTIVPDLDIAIHTSITGPDTGYKGRRNIHMYIMDLLMDEQPWLNTTDACTFPDDRTRRFLKIRNGIPASLPLQYYVGTFGNFGYGNISISLPVNGTLLRMEYGELGKWDLYPTQTAHKFLADGLDDVWSMDLANLWFETNQEGDAVEKLVVGSFENLFPPVFIRDLKMSEAPNPPELCPKAEKVISSTSNAERKALVISATIVSIVFHLFHW